MLGGVIGPGVVLQWQEFKPDDPVQENLGAGVVPLTLFDPGHTTIRQLVVTECALVDDPICAVRLHRAKLALQVEPVHGCWLCSHVHQASEYVFLNDRIVLGLVHHQEGVPGVLSKLGYTGPVLCAGAVWGQVQVSRINGPECRAVLEDARGLIALPLLRPDRLDLAGGHCGIGLGHQVTHHHGCCGPPASDDQLIFHVPVVIVCGLLCNLDRSLAHSHAHCVRLFLHPHLNASVAELLGPWVENVILGQPGRLHLGE